MEKKQGNFKRFQSESREYRAGRACGAKRIWKTTLCKILSGYEKPDSGQVLLDGKPLDFYGSYCPVQLIWQHPEQAINPRLRMRSVLEEGDNVSPDSSKNLALDGRTG